MKSAKKILALILAGVMALALLTGCGKATSLNRTVAEGLAEQIKSTLAQVENENNISVSYQVPELSRKIAPLFDENWITKNDRGDAVLNEIYKVNGNKTVKETLTDILNPYQSAPFVIFAAADVTDVKNPVIESSNLINSQIGFTLDDNDFDVTSITSLKVAVTHKTINDRTYALAVIIFEK
mgnify:CR=1 FL=1